MGFRLRHLNRVADVRKVRLVSVFGASLARIGPFVLRRAVSFE